MILRGDLDVGARRGEGDARAGDANVDEVTSRHAHIWDGDRLGCRARKRRPCLGADRGTVAVERHGGGGLPVCGDIRRRGDRDSTRADDLEFVARDGGGVGGVRCPAGHRIRSRCGVARLVHALTRDASKT